MMIITLHNRDGASDQTRMYWSHTVAGHKLANAWLRHTWSNPENLDVVITDGDGLQIGHKPFGKRKIKWARGAK